jgi:N-acetylglucosamine-6-phosphate deacetylase
MSVHVLPEGTWLAPGFIDLQVNGGGDVLFNDEPTLDGICAIAAAHRKFGTTTLLPTLITDRNEKVRLALQTANAVVGQCPAILGIHLEGPYLSPEKAGVHDARYMRRPTADDISHRAS